MEEQEVNLKVRVMSLPLEMLALIGECLASQTRAREDQIALYSSSHWVNPVCDAG